MKILSIELKNINSLAGTWKIDFTDPSFVQNHNIFVIFGDTGSGKSSILDAITIALYGCTPRQSRINNSHNEVMTRNTSSCFARIKYECRKGVFVSEWRQRRAKDKASGKLQDPEFRIEKEDGTIVAEGKAANLAQATQSIIELDYSQFVRSIILAQGEFSRFLDCKSNERAEILEKLDGSGNYRKIAVAIAARADQEERLFNAKKEKVDAIQGLLLSDEDIKQKKQELNTLAEKKGLLDKKIDVLRKYEHWYELLDEKKRNVADAQKKLVAAEEESSLFEPYRAKLLNAENALICEAPYTILESARKELKVDSEALKKANESLFKAEEELEICKKNREKASKSLADCEAELAEIQPVWEEIAILDARIANAATQVEKASAEYDTAFKNLDSSRTELSKVKGKKAGLLEKAGTYDSYKKENIIDSGISSILSGFLEKKNRLDAVCNDEDKFQKLKNELLPDITGLEEKQKNLESEINANEQYLKKNEKDSALTEKIPVAKTLCESLDAAEKSLSEAEGKLCLKADELSKKKADIETLEKAKEEVLSKLEAFFADDALFIAGELQKRLVKGKPCPVCGSLEHPACDGSAVKEENLSVMERTSAFAEKVREAQDKIDKTNVALQNAERDGALLEKEISNLNEQKVSLSNLIGETEEKLSALTEPWSCSLSGKKRASVVIVLSEKSASFNSNLKKLAELKEQSGKCTVALLDKRKDFDNYSTSVFALKAEKEKLLNEIKELCAPFLTADDYSTIDGELSVSVRSAVASVYDSLLKRDEQWRVNSENLEKIEAELRELSSKENVLSERINNLEENEKKAGVELESSRVALSALKADRKARFGDMSVEESRRVFDARLASLRAEVNKAQNDDMDAQLAVGNLKNSVSDYEKRTEADKMKLDSAAKAFLEKLSETGFSCEDEFVSARMDKTSLEALRKKSKELSERKISVESSVKDAERSLAEHEKIYSDIPSFEEIKEQSIFVEKELEDVTAHSASIRTVLESDRQYRKDSNETIKEFEAQKAIRDKWIRLQKLMGNKDGSTFSIFVQGITFRHLLKLANRHLALMKDRYELIPKDDVDFEINDASFSSPRSVTNISGGERFLISLSLALGIADFASRTVRVDSLFLDEGFGSLDGDTLRNVLDCLKRQQQKDGKMLGIITHVDAVVDSIAQKIEVKPSAGGHSVIRGEGVSHLGS